MDDPLARAFLTHNAIARKMVDALPPEAVADALAPRTRTVGSHLAHVHNVRLMWLKASAPDLLEPLSKLDPESVTKEALLAALEASGTAIAALLERGVAAGKIKGFKGSAAAFHSYFVAHEWYHLGKADLILRQAGHGVDDKLHYALWEDWARL